MIVVVALAMHKTKPTSLPLTYAVKLTAKHNIYVHCFYPSRAHACLHINIITKCFKLRQEKRLCVGKAVHGREGESKVGKLIPDK